MSLVRYSKVCMVKLNWSVRFFGMAAKHQMIQSCEARTVNLDKYFFPK